METLGEIVLQKMLSLNYLTLQFYYLKLFINEIDNCRDMFRKGYIFEIVCWVKKRDYLLHASLNISFIILHYEYFRRYISCFTYLFQRICWAGLGLLRQPSPWPHTPCERNQTQHEVLQKNCSFWAHTIILEGFNENLLV